MTIQKYYAKSTNGFYSSEVNGAAMPSDVVEITEQIWQQLLEAQSSGRVIASDNNGNPIAVEV